MVLRVDAASMDTKIKHENGTTTPVSSVTTAVLPIFAGAAHDKKTEISLEGVDKVSAEIDTVVELGKTAGIPKFPKEKIRALISQKIDELAKSIKDPYNTSSVRFDLCLLSRISSTHYSDLKEKVFDSLIRCLEEDPIKPHTANGVLEVVIALNEDLALKKAQL